MEFAALNNIKITQGLRSELLNNIQINHGFTANETAKCSELFIPKQKHTNIILENPDDMTENIADGVILTRPGKVGVQTADCVPLLISHSKFKAAIHCGWRGSFAGIIDRFFDWLDSHNYQGSDCQFVIGPAIFPPHYQVKEDFVTALYEWMPQQQSQHFLKIDSSTSWQFNLPAAIIYDLMTRKSVPAKNIEWIKENTYTSPQLHSYRRDSKQAGRNINWIEHV